MEVKFLPQDETAREILDAIHAIPEHSSERSELEAMLFITMARLSYREADRRLAAEHQERRRKSNHKPTT